MNHTTLKLRMTRKINVKQFVMLLMLAVGSLSHGANAGGANYEATATFKGVGEMAQDLHDLLEILEPARKNNEDELESSRKKLDQIYEKISKNYKEIELLNTQNSKYRDELNQVYREMDRIRDKQSVTSKTAASAFKKLETSAGKVARQRSEASATAKASK